MSSGSFVCAGISINEIMYDLEGSDADREWIEVLNTGSESVDIKNYVLKDSPTSSNHALSPSMGGTLLSAGAYAVIASDANKFRTDWPLFSGMLLSSNFTLGNTGDTISLKPTKDLPASSEVSYLSSQGASGNGKTLQRVSEAWVEGVPTPGAVNADGSETATGTPDAGTTVSATSAVPASNTDPAKKEFIAMPRITAEIIAKGHVVAGVPAIFDGKVLGYDRSPLSTGKFYWNFGDGTSRTVVGTGPGTVKKFEHLYPYPGEYAVTFAYYRDYYTEEPEASSRFIVRVSPAEVKISSVGGGSDPYVELYNTSSSEMDISRWVIQGKTQSFVLPERTYVLPGKKIIISGESTRFSADDLSALVLTYPGGKSEFVFGGTVPVLLPTLTPSIKGENKTVVQAGLVHANTVLTREQTVPASSITDVPHLQSATVVESVSKNQDTGDRSDGDSRYWPVLGLLGIVAVASGVSFAIRKKRPTAGLRADDIKIIE